VVLALLALAIHYLSMFILTRRCFILIINLSRKKRGNCSLTGHFGPKTLQTYCAWRHHVGICPKFPVSYISVWLTSRCIFRVSAVQKCLRNNTEIQTSSNPELNGSWVQRPQDGVQSVEKRSCCRCGVESCRDWSGEPPTDTL